MSLHLSPAMNSARLETRRHCARQSTGLRTMGQGLIPHPGRPERSLERAENKGYPPNHNIAKLTTY